MVASTACGAPCHNDSPLATVSMRRSSETGTSMFMSARRTLRATRAPVSWHTLANARSRGRARHASTPAAACEAVVAAGRGSGEDCEGARSVWPGLRQQQCSRCGTMRRTRSDPQRLVVLGSEVVGGRCGRGALALVRDLVRLRRLRAPPALRHAAATAWARRWQLSVAVQRATALSAAGRAWPAASHAAADAPAFELVLDLADAAGPSMLPFRA